MNGQLLELQREDFQNALKDMDTYIDVTVEDLLMIAKTAQKHAQLREAETLSVSEIMTAGVKTVHPDTTVKDAARLLLDQKISGLPVISPENKLVGVVTEADFLCAMGIPCHHPAHSVWHTLESMFNAAPRNNLLPKVVADIMSTQTVTVGLNQTLHDVIDSMKRNHVKRVIVVDSEKYVVGIITRSNLVRVLLQQIL